MKHTVKKVFIAGGTGFLGYYSALKFLEMGIRVDTVALPNEIDLGTWYPKEIGLSFANLFEMPQEDIVKMLAGKNYDAFVYGLGPDDRFIPDAPAYEFFYDKLVTQCKKICEAAKLAKIKRCVIMNSYFAHFDRKTGGALSQYHPYIRARVDQARELTALGEDGKFDVMILELPYIFGTMPNRKPLWRDSFLAHFDGMKSVMFPNGGGTAAITVEGVAEAVVAAVINGENGKMYPIGKINITYKDLVNFMLSASKDTRKFKGIPAFLCALGTKKLDKDLAKQGKESGLNHAKLMTQIQNKKFYIDPTPIEEALGYKELGFTGGGDVYESIKKTMRECYPERFQGEEN